MLSQTECPELVVSELVVLQNRLQEGFSQQDVQLESVTSRVQRAEEKITFLQADVRGLLEQIAHKEHEVQQEAAVRPLRPARSTDDHHSTPPPQRRSFLACSLVLPSTQLPRSCRAASASDATICVTQSAAAFLPLQRCLCP